VKATNRFQRMVYDRMGESWTLLIDLRGAESKEFTGKKLSRLSAVLTSRTWSTVAEELESCTYSRVAWSTLATDGNSTAVESDGAFLNPLHKPRAFSQRTGLFHRHGRLTLQFPICRFFRLTGLLKADA
jgi:hypothetical protein